MTMTKDKSLFDDDTEKPEDVGEVFVKTSKGLFPVNVLKANQTENKSKSRQLKEEHRWATEHGLVPHPFEVSSLLFLQDNCGYFDACVRQIASDVVGQGWEIKSIKEGTEDEKEKEEIERFLLDPNDTDEDISDIISKAIVDWSVIGWWGIETSRDDGILDGIWHVPAATLYVHNSKEKYCQVRNNKKMWFKKFGSDMTVSSKDGAEYKTTKNPAHELLFYTRYYPQSDYYGVPAIFPAVASVMGILGIRDYNLAFFDNYGVPSALVTLKGRWAKKAAEQITEFIDVEIKGSGNAHKTLVLKPPRDGDVEWKPMAVKIEEGSFRLYLKILRDDVLSVYKMPPYRIGIAETGSLGGSTAEEMTKIYGNSIIAPLKKITALMVTKRIIRDGLQKKKYRFEWKPLDTRDMDALTKRLVAQVGMGAITPSMAAQELGRPAYTAGDQYYIAANYVPVGQENVEKREAALIAELETLKGMVDQAIKQSNDAMLRQTGEEE